MTIHAILLGLLSALPAAAQASKQPAVPIASTLCAVMKNPSAYNGKLLKIRASYVTDHIERSLLIDDSCGVSAVLPCLRDEAIGSDAFKDAANVCEPQHLKQTMVATFTGYFHFREKPEMCMILNKEVCRRSFEIVKIEDLILTMTSNEKKQ